jgi:GT2 family glycosyltransferase
VPLLDIVIVNYNAGLWLRRVVAALHAQTFSGFRTIIVDNGSTDGSLDGLPKGATPVEIIRAGRNLGFAKGTISRFAATSPQSAKTSAKLRSSMTRLSGRRTD